MNYSQENKQNNCIRRLIQECTQDYVEDNKTAETSGAKKASLQSIKVKSLQGICCRFKSLMRVERKEKKRKNYLANVQFFREFKKRCWKEKYRPSFRIWSSKRWGLIRVSEINNNKNWRQIMLRDLSHKQGWQRMQPWKETYVPKRTPANWCKQESRAHIKTW